MLEIQAAVPQARMLFRSGSVGFSEALQPNPPPVQHRLQWVCHGLATPLAAQGTESTWPRHCWVKRFA